MSRSIATTLLIAATLTILGGCKDSDPLTVAICLDGWEIAQLRESCLGPTDPDAQWGYDPEACRQVRVDLTCDDPSTGAAGFLMVAPQEAQP